MLGRSARPRRMILGECSVGVGSRESTQMFFQGKKSITLDPYALPYAVLISIKRKPARGQLLASSDTARRQGTCNICRRRRRSCLSCGRA